MTYSGVAAIVLVSFGVFVWTGIRGFHGAGVFDVLRHLGATGSRGYHLAALAIMLTVLAAPLDELWHRLFGLDVTIWSPPHLLGLLGGILNAAACWLIACEVYPEGRRSRLAALVLAGAIVYAGMGFGLQPAFQIAYLNGGVWFFTYPMLAALVAPIALVVTARVSRVRAAPVLVILVVFLIALVGAEVSRMGFAWLQPESFLTEEIAKDPTSPIAVAHEMARKKRHAAGRVQPRVYGLAALGQPRDGGGRCATPARAGVGGVWPDPLHGRQRRVCTLARLRRVATVCTRDCAGGGRDRAGRLGWGRARERGSGAARARSRKGLEGPYLPPAGALQCPGSSDVQTQPSVTIVRIA